MEIRKRLGDDLIAEMNDKIYEFSQAKASKKKDRASPQADESELDPIHKGEVIFDATACPQDIAYPTISDYWTDPEKSQKRPLITFMRHIHKGRSLEPIEK